MESLEKSLHCINIRSKHDQVSQNNVYERTTELLMHDTSIKKYVYKGALSISIPKINPIPVPFLAYPLTSLAKFERALTLHVQ